MTNLTDTRTSDVEIRIATIIADCKVAGTSANETTRQVLEALTSFRESVAAEERESFKALLEKEAEKLSSAESMEKVMDSLARAEECYYLIRNLDRLLTPPNKTNK